MKTAGGLCLLAALAGTAAGQSPMNRRKAEAVLSKLQAATLPRLRCEVTPVKPALDFGWRFHAGYVLHVPMSQYIGPGHQWSVVIKVTPEGKDPVYLGATYPLPDVPKTKAQLGVGGGYELGEGRYEVDLLLVDDDDRVCRKSWRATAALSRDEKRLKMGAAPGSVRSLSSLRLAARGAGERDAKPLRLTVLLHAAPSYFRMTHFRARDQHRLLSALASLLEQLPTQSVRVIAFNLDQQRELFRSEDFDAAAFESLGQELQKLELGTVDYQVLKNRKGHTELLADLVNEQLEAEKAADAVVFLGPTARFDDRVGPEMISEHGTGSPRFFYFQYKSLRERGAELPDSIEKLMKRLGGRTMRIHTPGEFAKAVDQLSAAGR